MVVYTPSDSFSGVADRIAAARDDRVISDEAKIDETEPVIYVVDPARIDEELLLTLQKRQLRNGPAEAQFGVITGFTPEDAESLYFSRTDCGTGHAIVEGDNQVAAASVEDETTILDRDDLTPTALESVTQERLSSLCLSIGGSTIHLLFQGGFICGMTDPSEIAEEDGKIPFCVEDGERNCPYEDELIPADSITASHVFLNACTPVTANQSTGKNGHVALNILRRSASLIGPYRFDFTETHEAILYYALLRSGYSVSEITYVLNKNSHSNDVMSHPFVCFGRPGTRCADTVSPEFQVDCSGSTIEITDIDAFAADFTVPGTLVDGDSDRLYLSPDDDLEDPLYYSAFREGDDFRVVIYSTGRIERDRLQVQFSDRPYRYDDRQIGARSVQNVQRTQSMGIAGEAVREQAENIRKQVQSFATDSVNEKYRVDVAQTFDGRIDSITGAVDNMTEKMLDELRDGAMLTSKYARTAVEFDHAASPETRCPTCGNTLHLKKLTDPAGEAKRVIATCASQRTCGCRRKFDVPLHAGTDLMYPVVEGDIYDTGDADRTISVTFQNSRDVPVRATVFPTIWRNGDTIDGEPIFDPASVTTTLSPGSTMEASFDVNVDVLRPNEHYIQAQVIGNLDVYSSLMPFFLGSKGNRQFY